MLNKLPWTRKRLCPTLMKRLRKGSAASYRDRHHVGGPLCYSLTPASLQLHQRQPRLYSSFAVISSVSRQVHNAQTTKSRRCSSQMTLSERIPPNSWDSHMHVVDPDKYPLASDAQYTPTPHTLSNAMSFYSTIGINNMVLVQPSIYGNDNSCMLDALRAIGPRRGRAVVTFDPSSTAPETLQEWHDLGVRGARLNLQSVGREMDGDELSATLQLYARAIRPLHWVLQLYVPLNMVAGLEAIVPGLGVRVCLDHFANPLLPDPARGELYTTSGDPYTLPGFGSLVNLLRQGSTYVKLSAPYRISKQEDQRDLDPLAKELLNVAGKRRVVFATDWPHTRFAGLDIKPFMERVLKWCGDDRELVERLFRGNAEDLWDIKA